MMEGFSEILTPEGTVNRSYLVEYPNCSDMNELSEIARCSKRR